MSPEGVALSVEIADNGERATALVLDLFIWLCATIVLCLAAWLTLGKLAPVMLQGSALAAIVLFIGFVIRNLYFIHFELAWQGATPGKRIVGLRVVDRAGGPLLPGAVIARNLTREIEAFMPIGILMSAQTQRWEMLSIGIWLMLFTLLPCFNRNHLRVGDLIAGTMVIAIPRRVLLGDLVETAYRHSFTERQLGAYGAFELQVLEELLRRPENAESGRLRREVCERICRKIGWANAGRRGRCRALPQGFLYRRARLPRARAALRQAARRQEFPRPHRRLSRDQSNTTAICSTSPPSLISRRS